MKLFQLTLICCFLLLNNFYKKITYDFKGIKMETTIEKTVSTQITSIKDIINEEIASRKNEKPFYVANMLDIYKKHIQWIENLPRVKPFYAVKCNNLPEVIAFLALNGTGFDCASKQEIDQVLALGVDPSKIIYANPCKTRSFIKHANSVGINVMTFDNELELHKIASVHPNAKLVLRIKGDDSHSICKFNIKFGADLSKCQSLLETATKLNLAVIGVSFHNGSNCEDTVAFEKTIADCRQIFDLAKQLGHSMYLLDIGGGFPGHETKLGIPFKQYAQVINTAIDKHFPKVDPISGEETNYEIIAEPGRYYVASAFVFCAMVIAKKVERDAVTGKECYSYYINDGVYGAFNNVIFDHQTPTPVTIGAMDEQPTHLTTLWGPTCDSIDCIRKNFMFPELEIGEWISFKNMGAYTQVASSNFNGFEKASVIVAV